MKKALRTPESCFNNLEGYSFAPHYAHVKHLDYEPLRLHYIDEGNSEAPPILFLHGCPAWSYLYRKVIDSLLSSSHSKKLRIIAPDHIGCGKSDKLLHRSDYSYDFYVSTIQSLIEQLDLKNITLVCQDWGGPIGLRMFSEMPERFTRIVASNTLLPNCEAPPKGVDNWPGDIIKNWVNFTKTAEDLQISQIIQGVCVSRLSKEVLSAYDAPFPDALYKQGILNWPSLIPLNLSDTGVIENKRVWEALEKSNIPFLTAFSDKDPSTILWEDVFLHRIKNARQEKIKNAGHMVQEDQGEFLGRLILEFIFSK